jgi:hypothetical protein
MAQAEIYADQLQWQKEKSPGRLNLVPGFIPRHCEICSKSDPWPGVTSRAYWPVSPIDQQGKHSYADETVDLVGLRRWQINFDK